jgi:arylsulfatase A-like enzyme
MSLGPLVGEAEILGAINNSSADRQVNTSDDDDLGRMSVRLSRTFTRGPLNQIVEGPNRTVVHTDDYLTDFFADRAVDFVQRSTPAGTPYFLYLAFNAVHAPHMVIEKYYARFSDIKDHQLRVYAAMVAALDEAVGKVTAAVEATGEAGNTIIYFASDNGCAEYFPALCSCTPLRGGKLSHYEGGTRVRLL